MDTHMHAGARDLSITRLIPATPEQVFAAWTQPDRVKQWFGPYGMTIPIAEVDLRVGGLHHTVMRDADGKEYDNPMVIEAVDAPHRLVLRVPEDTCCPVPGSVGTLTFEAEGDGLTRLTARWAHPTPDMRAHHEELGFAKGWGETLDKLTAHMVQPPAGCPVGTPASPEHGWLHRLLGTWEYESECAGPPGSSPMKAKGTERVRSLGGYWVVGESEGQMPGSDDLARWTVTMGYDAGAKRFRGTFVGSMMPHMFIYDGALEPDGRTLTLMTEGPAMTGEGTARYRDVVELLDDDTRLMTSAVEGADGSWTEFMSAKSRRIR